MAKQGWVGDCFDPAGRLIGSRLFLLQGAKSTEQTRQLAESAGAEGLAHFREQNGLKPGVKARYLSTSMLAIIAVVAKTEITLHRVLG